MWPRRPPRPAAPSSSSRTDASDADAALEVRNSETAISSCRESWQMLQDLGIARSAWPANTPLARYHETVSLCLVWTCDRYGRLWRIRSESSNHSDAAAAASDSLSHIADLHEVVQSSCESA